MNNLLKCTEHFFSLLQQDDAMEEDDDDEDSNQEKPSEEMIEEMEEKLDTTQSELKNLFLIIFQVSLWNKDKYQQQTNVNTCNFVSSQLQLLM